MLDHSPFLTAIRETPDDDTLRLVYADWLEENDEYLSDRERATREYIRLSCGYTPQSERVEHGWLRYNWQRLFTLPLAFNPWPKDGKDRLAYFTVAPANGFCDPFTLGFRRGFIESVKFGSYHLERILPVVVPQCPVAWFTTAGYVSWGSGCVYIHDFAPREIWQDIQGHDGVESRGIYDLKIFNRGTHDENSTRAQAALSDALRAYGERVSECEESR
jgi:uncharacterized protein (TIGR02996 family)